MKLIEIKTEDPKIGLKLLVQDLACTEDEVLVITNRVSSIKKYSDSSSSKAIKKAHSNGVELDFLVGTLKDTLDKRKDGIKRVYVLNTPNFTLSNYDLYNLAKSYPELVWVFTKQIGA